MSADDLPFGIVSTDNIKVSERREFWEASAVPLFGQLQLEAPSGQPFDASVAYAGLADLVLCRLSASISHRVVRTDAVARNDNRAYVKAVFQSKGSSVVEQCGRRAVLRPGEWSVYDAARSYSVAIPDRAEVYILMIPHDRILRGNFDLHKVMLRRLSGHRGLGKLAWSLVSATFDQIQAIQNRSSHDVADLVVQMTRLALVDSAEDGSSVHSNEALRSPSQVLHFEPPRRSRPFDREAGPGDGLHEALLAHGFPARGNVYLQLHQEIEVGALS